MFNKIIIILLIFVITPTGCLAKTETMNNVNSSEKQISEQEIIPNRGFSAEEQKSCLLQGGIYVMSGGQGGKYICDFQTEDAGKECTSSSQCKIFCAADWETASYGSKTKGKCYGFEKIMPDCWAKVENGVVSEMSCQ